MSTMHRDGNLYVIENTSMLFRNFSGLAREFNPEGNRNFCVVLDNDIADTLQAEGFNVQRRPGLNEGDPDTCFMQVAVRFDKVPPDIYVVTHRNMTKIGEDNVSMLDTVRVNYIDIAIRPSYWSRPGRSGIKAYLSSLYVNVSEDYLHNKYADMSFDDSVPFD